MALSEEDIKQIAEALAPQLVDRVRESKHAFWIDPEEHYLHHKNWDDFRRNLGDEEQYDLKNIVKMYRITKSLWFKAFLGFAAVGTVIAIAASMGFHR